jgi:hypothetical protein
MLFESRKFKWLWHLYRLLYAWHTVLRGTSVYIVKFGCNLPFKWSQPSLPLPNRINIRFSRAPTLYYSNAVPVFNIPLDVTHLLHCSDVHMNPGPSSDQHSDNLQHTGIPHNVLWRTHNGDYLRIVYTAAYSRFLQNTSAKQLTCMSNYVCCHSVFTIIIGCEAGELVSK